MRKAIAKVGVFSWKNVRTIANKAGKVIVWVASMYVLGITCKLYPGIYGCILVGLVVSCMYCSKKKNKTAVQVLSRVLQSLVWRVTIGPWATMGVVSWVLPLLPIEVMVVIIAAQIAIVEILYMVMQVPAAKTLGSYICNSRNYPAIANCSNPKAMITNPDTTCVVFDTTHTNQIKQVHVREIIDYQADNKVISKQKVYNAYKSDELVDLSSEALHGDLLEGEGHMQVAEKIFPQEVDTTAEKLRHECIQESINSHIRKKLTGVGSGIQNNQRGYTDLGECVSDGKPILLFTDVSKIKIYENEQELWQVHAVLQIDNTSKGSINTKQGRLTAIKASILGKRIGVGDTGLVDEFLQQKYSVCSYTHSKICFINLNSSANIDTQHSYVLAKPNIKISPSGWDGSPVRQFIAEKNTPVTMSDLLITAEHTNLEDLNNVNNKHDEYKNLR